MFLAYKSQHVLLFHLEEAFLPQKTGSNTNLYNNILDLVFRYIYGIIWH